MRNVDEGDVAWMGGLPVTRAERTLADLCLDCEDPSLVEGAFRDAAAPVSYTHLPSQTASPFPHGIAVALAPCEPRGVRFPFE